MNKTIINVPKGIRFISEWPNFSVNPLAHILDKKIPGCGFTEWVLTNKENVILCSPRLMLIDNKASQHEKEVMVVKGSGVDMRIDVDLEDKNLPLNTRKFLEKLEEMEKPSEEETRKSITKDIQEKLKVYIKARAGQPLKLITTYDSFRILKDVLEFNKILDKFHVYVDEFQSIFTDSRFKADTELSFVDSLKNLNPCYVSATPMMEKYLDKLDDFKNLPYYELDWEKEDVTRVIKPSLKVRTVSSIISKALEIIKSYLSGDYDKIILQDGTVVESKEATFFVNSVNNITSIINRAKLSLDQVNILCAKTDENEDKIKKRLGKDWKIGNVPLRNEPRKMFTFCTRTVYLGADFYSDNSRTFIFSDASIETLSVDISLDLPQILGRQRLNSNPWKNNAEFYYKTIFKKNDDRKKLTQALIDRKMAFSNATLDSIKKLEDIEKENLIDLSMIAIRTTYYKTRYIGFDKKTGNIVINNLVLIAEQRAFDIQDIDYSDRFVMFNTIQKAIGLEATSELSNIVGSFWSGYKDLTKTEDKLRYVCSYNFPDEIKDSIYLSLEPKIRNYLFLGKEKIKAMSYNITDLNNLLDSKFSGSSLSKTVHKEFQVGNKYTKVEIKNKLKEIYSSLGLKITAKASDIENWFETRRCQPRVNGKQVEGLELIKKLK